MKYFLLISFLLIWGVGFIYLVRFIVKLSNKRFNEVLQEPILQIAFPLERPELDLQIQTPGQYLVLVKRRFESTFFQGKPFLLRIHIINKKKLDSPVKFNHLFDKVFGKNPRIRYFRIGSFDASVSGSYQIQVDNYDLLSANSSLLIVPL